MYANDTIAAIATPPGAGGIGIVRLSGPRAVAIAELLFSPGRTAASAESHRLRHGHIVDATGEPIDEALLVVMLAPHSYSGEDVVELQCHGSPVVLRLVLERCLEGGARLAEPGEFTKRAFLNGRIDLVQSEAVAELITARTEAAARAGMRHLSGRLSTALAELRAALVEIKARAEVMIDFSEEETDVSPDLLLAGVETARARVDGLLQSFGTGRLLRNGIHLTLVGRPNVGKSSLLNALLGRDRAIVTPVPGTTRDVIAESVDIQGIPVVVADTAGIRAGGDMIESLGIERTRREAAAADAVLVVLDRSEPLGPDDLSVLAEARPTAVLVVVNKSDLPAAWQPPCTKAVAALPWVEVSAATGAGVDRLRQAIVDLAGGGVIDPHAPLVTLVRHREALARALDALVLAHASLLADAPIDATTVDIQAAV